MHRKNEGTIYWTSPYLSLIFSRILSGQPLSPHFTNKKMESERLSKASWEQVEGTAKEGVATMRTSNPAHSDLSPHPLTLLCPWIPHCPLLPPPHGLDSPSLGSSHCPIPVDLVFPGAWVPRHTGTQVGILTSPPPATWPDIYKNGSALSSRAKYWKHATCSQMAWIWIPALPVTEFGGLSFPIYKMGKVYEA